MADIPIILLAAGGSTRMGRPKQLLPWGNQTLIEHLIQTLLKTGNPVNTILGANANLVIPVIAKFNVNIFINKHWENGMGSSIALGIHQLSKMYPEAGGALISLLDQPLVTVNHLEKLLRLFQPGNQQIIVSQAESGWQGVPVLFDQTYFKELTNLDSEEGAKTVIRQHRISVIAVNCGEILEDMDTPESYRRMLELFLKNSKDNSF